MKAANAAEPKFKARKIGCEVRRIQFVSPSTGFMGGYIGQHGMVYRYRIVPIVTPAARA